MTILINFLLVVYMAVALLMLLVIVMQRPKSEGLGAAFGGGVTENIFGAQTTNVLVKFTAWLAGIFFVLTFVLSILYARQSTGDKSLRRELLKEQTGAAVSPSPASSPAPDSGAGVNPAGSATPVATSSAPATASPAASATAAQSPASTPKTSKRKTP